MIENNLALAKEDINKEFKKIKGPQKKILAAAAITVIIAGVGSGYFLSRGGTFFKEDLKKDVTQEEVKPGVTVGIADEKTFKDSTEGKLEKGGIDGEGSHHLVREGGESQTVYLTSSVVDLSIFIGHKVKVWGETHTSQKAGWLMDVGKLKVLD